MSGYRRTLIAVAATAGVAAAAFAVSCRDSRAFPLPSPVTLPFEDINKHVFLPVIVNGSRPLAFVLDTGDKYSVVDLARARELGLAFGTPVTVRGIGEQTDAGAFVKDASYSVAGLAGFSQPLALAIPLARMTPEFGHDFDGILGADFIREFVLAIDYQARTITFYDANTFSYAGNGTRLPVVLNAQDHPVVEGSVTPVGGTPIPARFVIDIGSGGSLTLFSPFVAQHRLPGAATETIPFVAGGGTGGDTTGKLGRVEALHIGTVIIKRPIVNFSEDKTGNFAASAEQGNVGAEILRRFRVILDYRRSQIVLEPTSQSAVAFDRAFSGLRVQSEGQTHTTFRVIAVLPQSPAARAGFEPGDVIGAVDGEPAATLTLSRILSTLETAGLHQLSVVRGARTLSLSLTPHRL